jgi:pyridoxal phosphate enzyme (YggS family)
MDYSYINDNYHALLKEIEEIASNAHGQHVTLVAVTKSGSDEELLALCKAGATDIGENRPQELKRRGDLIKEAGFKVRLHEIGNLQKNKVKLIAESVSLIHSVDSVSLAEQISRQAIAAGRKIPVLIEVNSAKEPDKGGVTPECAEELFLSIRSLEGISVRGVMTMGPVCENAEEIRPYFRLTKNIFDKIKNAYGFDGEPILSMGMSDSYRIAIEEGATLVRVGRRLFIKS